MRAARKWVRASRVQSSKLSQKAFGRQYMLKHVTIDIHLDGKVRGNKIPAIDAHYAELTTSRDLEVVDCSAQSATLVQAINTRHTISLRSQIAPWGLQCVQTHLCLRVALAKALVAGKTDPGATGAE